MHTPIMVGVLAFLFFVGGVKSGLFDEVLRQIKMLKT